MYNSDGTMIGIGITMEAIEQNYVVYEAVLENKWLDGKVENISKWVEDYSSRRYGDNNISQVKQAWEIMLQNIYFSPYHNTSQIEKVPSFTSNIKIDPEKLSVYGRYKNTVGAGLIGTIEDLWNSLFVEIIKESVEVRLKIPVRRGVIEFRRTYQDEDIVKLNLNIALTPFYRLEGEIYHLLSSKDKKDKQIEINIGNTET